MGRVLVSSTLDAYTETGVMSIFIAFIATHFISVLSRTTGVMGIPGIGLQAYMRCLSRLHLSVFS